MCLYVRVCASVPVYAYVYDENKNKIVRIWQSASEAEKDSEILD